MKDIAGFEGLYTIDPDGNVYNKDGHKIKPYLDRKGYYRVTLNQKVDGKWKSKLCQVHRLLAIAYIPNPDNKPQVNHINGVRDDNSLENLEWATAQENVQNGFDRGREVWNKHMKSTANMTLEDLARELPRLQELAKAMWGEGYALGGHEVLRYPAWQYHLQQMVIAENPLEYLKENM